MPIAKTIIAIPEGGIVPGSRVSGSTHFSWSCELKNIFSVKFLHLFFWHLFKKRQKCFTTTVVFKLCRRLPGFAALWSTIQKGSFAYNTLFLGIKPFYRASVNTLLADVTTLALFFGDEFIDGIRLSAGKQFVLDILNNNPQKFYMRCKLKRNRVVLEYSFDLLKLLPEYILAQVNVKYCISYRQFYFLLRYFLRDINSRLSGMPLEKAVLVAEKISDACNTCLESYVHDVRRCPEQDMDADITSLLQYHELKTRYMQRKLLDVRCCLVDRQDAMLSIQSQGWINIMSVVQIYDDMQDIVVDDGFQDNLLLCVARRHFPGEWQWFRENKSLLAGAEETHLLTSLNMPGSVYFCLHLASEKVRRMNWEQQKIMHYLLKKNWFIARECCDVAFAKTSSLAGIYRFIQNKMPHISPDLLKGYAVDTCFHKQKARKELFKKVSFSTAYQLRYNLLAVPDQIKTAVFDAVIKTQQYAGQ